MSTTTPDDQCREVLCMTIQLFDAEVEQGDDRPLANCSEVAAALDSPDATVAECLRLLGLAGHIKHERSGDDTMSVVLDIYPSGRALCPN